MEATFRNEVKWRRKPRQNLTKLWETFKLCDNRLVAINAAVAFEFELFGLKES